MTTPLIKKMLERLPADATDEQREDLTRLLESIGDGLEAALSDGVSAAIHAANEFIEKLNLIVKKPCCYQTMMQFRSVLVGAKEEMDKKDGVGNN